MQGALGSGNGHEPKVIYLRYADGSETHTSNYDACNTGTVPKFECTFAPTLVECQRQIQAYLDAWYADFNVIFTLTRPTSGKYYTEVVSSGGGAWCKVDDKVAGVAPFLCKDLAGRRRLHVPGRPQRARDGGDHRAGAGAPGRARAHDQRARHHVPDHQHRLRRASSTATVRSRAIAAIATTQNSYQMMKKALGDWPGGPKPSRVRLHGGHAEPPAFGSCRPATASKMGHDFAVTVDVHDDCDVKKVEIQVMPQGLSAVAMAAPYEWDLTGINGAQTITVTATDGSGRTGSATLEVTAPETREELGAGRERRRRRLQRRVGRVRRGGPGAVAGDVAALQRQEPPQPVAARSRRAHAVAPRPSPSTNRRELRVAHAAAERPLEREQRDAQQQQRRAPTRSRPTAAGRRAPRARSGSRRRAAPRTRSCRR